MRLIHGYPEVFVPFLIERIAHVHPSTFAPAVAQTMGVVSDAGDILGVVAFHGWQPMYASVEVSTAAGHKRWLTRHIIQQIFAYPFVQLGCERVSATTTRRAKGARRFLKQFGFHFEGVGRQGFGPWGDAMGYSLLRQDYFASRWAQVREPARNEAAEPAEAVEAVAVASADDDPQLPSLSVAESVAA